MPVLHQALASLAVVALLGCSRATSTPPNGTRAAASFVDTHGDVIGAATLTELQDGGVAILVRAAGLEPGEHGFHVHETGICEPPAFESAGGHLNPGGHPHGEPGAADSHAGDLPSLRIDSDGSIDTTLVVASVTLDDGPRSLLRDGGTALMIHAGADDYRTDPSGASGARVACGVVARSR